MSTLEKIGFWDDDDGQPAAHSMHATFTPGSGHDEPRENAGSLHARHARRAFSANRSRKEDFSQSHENGLARTGLVESMECLECLDAGSKSAGPKNAEPGVKMAEPGVPGLRPVGYVHLNADDPGDDGMEWEGEMAPEDMPPSRDKPDWWEPKPLAEGSLVARLVAVGATVNAYGKCASVRAPAGIPADLLHEVEARGWRIIPGGKPNPEAEHDSWLAGVPIRELNP